MMRTSRVVLMVVVCLAVAALGGTQTLAPMSAGVIPVVAHLPGTGTSQWSTSVYVAQTTGEAPATVRFSLLDPGGEAWETSITVGGNGGAAELADVVRAAGAPNGKYVATWWSTQPVVVSSRTFTTEASGSYGQGIASVAPGSGFGVGGEVTFPAPVDFDGHRVNVGIANSGPGEQSFTIATRDASGATLKSWTKTVAAGAIEQFRANEDGFTGAGSVMVRCDSGCDGSAFGYTSVVVNDSNDAYFQYAAAAAGQAQVAPVSTVRDAKGVWFITGGSLYDVYEAMGYAVASDRLWQAETYRRSSRGTMAEVFGSSFLQDDILVRTTGYSEAELKAQFSALPAEEKSVIQGYVDGFNRRIAEVKANPSQLPFEFKAVGQSLGTTFVPADWTVTDVIAWMTLLLRQFDPEATDTGQLDNAALLQELGAAFPSQYQGMFADLRWINDPAAQTYIPDNAGATGISPKPATSQLAALPPMADAARRIRERQARFVADTERINARVKMGSYAWVVSADKSADGHPIIYSGPQMGFYVPSITLEGSIVGGGLAVSGMTIAGIPGIIIGRTPHHAWSMQVGHAHTVDYYLEAPQSVQLNRVETIHVAGGSDVTLPVYRTPRGPVVDPVPYDPANPPATIVSWHYTQWKQDGMAIRYALRAARAQSIAEFGQAIQVIPVSQHFCYADRDGNIAYWMSGYDYVRPAGVDVRLPQLADPSSGKPGAVQVIPRPHDENTAQGWYGGWNNKAEVDYNNATNNFGYYFGPAHRAHVVKEYLDSHNDLTYQQVNDLALNIATTDSFGGGGNPWEFVESAFTAAVEANPTADRTAALALLDGWDGHFVAGGSSAWVSGLFRSDAWVLQDAWLREVMRLTFDDELTTAGTSYNAQPKGILFNVLLHAMAGESASIVNQYDWFQDASGSGLPTTLNGIIVRALDNVLATLGPQPWNVARGYIRYRHDILGEVHTTPFASRSTYAHEVEMGPDGPMKIRSMFPLGESGTILADEYGAPVFDANFFSMAPVYDAFAPRDFPLFASSGSSTSPRP